MKKTICSLVAGLILQGCVSFGYERPMDEEYKMIGNIPYNAQTMNCVDRAVVYHRLLRSQGHQSRIISGHVYTAKPGVNHAWVEVYHDGEWYNTELNTPANKVTDRNRIWEYYPNATRNDIDNEIGMRLDGRK